MMMMMMSTINKIVEKIRLVKEIYFDDEDGVPYVDIVRIWIVMDLEKHFTPTIKIKKTNA